MPVTQQENGGGGLGSREEQILQSSDYSLICNFLSFIGIHQNNIHPFYGIYLCYAGNGDIMRIMSYRVDPKIRHSPITI